MKKHKQKLFCDLKKDLVLIQTLHTYRTISIEIQNKLNELKNLFKKLKSASHDPTSCTDNISNLHLKIAMRTYEIARSLRKDTEFIKSYSNEIRLIYTTLRSMSAAHLTQIVEIPESNETLLTCANILNKAAYYCLTKDSQNMAEILLKKSGYLISNIKNTRSKEYRVTTAKTTAAMDLLCPKIITSDATLENPEFFYFDLQENIPKNIYDEISKLFPNSKIENVTTPNLEATKKIPEKYNSFLKTIKNHKKYDSLLIYFIECYISHRGELLFQRHKECLSAFANLEYNANQEYLSKNSDNTPSMNNAP
jgi:hypothetical protein